MTTTHQLPVYRELTDMSADEQETYLDAVTKALTELVVVGIEEWARECRMCESYGPHHYECREDAEQELERHLGDDLEIDGSIPSEAQAHYSQLLACEDRERYLEVYCAGVTEFDAWQRSLVSEIWDQYDEEA